MTRRQLGPEVGVVLVRSLGAVNEELYARNGQEGKETKENVTGRPSDKLRADALALVAESADGRFRFRVER
ncbi:MAG: hypothetical protein OXU63_07010 [Acidobacteriota bacterium]|nr:hypothetical protein [Acidobacteriota bacterium]